MIAGLYFNPRSHEGSDPSRPDNSKILPADFNPRSHEGSDFRETYSGSALTAISIHAPTRGATKPAKKKPVDEDISIHAPTRGATTYTLGITDTYAISIHAPTRGATLELRIAAHYANISILAPTRGATYTRKNVSLSTRLFQSSLPRGERHRDI